MIFATVVFASQSVSAYTWSVSKAHVKIVEGSYVPYSVNFAIDQVAGAVQIGAWIKYANTDKDRVKAIYAMLLSAISSGQPITIYGTGDTIEFIHLYSE